MSVFIDKEYKCHVSNDGTMREFEVRDLDGKCPAFVEGHRYVPNGETWTRSDGEVFTGEMLTVWRDSSVLDEFQAQYEAQQVETEQLRAELADADAALRELGAEWEETDG